ncbi:MAG TPA: hypothetical protein VMC41_02110 [Candidatus Nanoarchaeia archaeon]|nr:hypothetical protein [Candidatus Nanoarchaeia archaeon]
MSEKSDLRNGRFVPSTFTCFHPDERLAKLLDEHSFPQKTVKRIIGGRGEVIAPTNGQGSIRYLDLQVVSGSGNIRLNDLAPENIRMFKFVSSIARDYPEIEMFIYWPELPVK